MGSNHSFSHRANLFLKYIGIYGYLLVVLHTHMLLRFCFIR